MELFLAIIIGFLFGAVLNYVGAFNPQNIIQMLRFRDLRLMKSILFAIGFACLILFAGLQTGFIDAAHLSVKSAYVGVFIGGLLLGVGFALAGYCPGTGLGAAATGRIDALFFVAGGLVGALLYMLTYTQVKATGILEAVFGGKTTLAETGSEKYVALLQDAGLSAFIMGAVLMLVAYFLPTQLLGKNR